MQSCLLVLDGSSNLANALVAVQILQKQVGVSNVCVCTDNYNIQRTLQEKFQKISVLFAPTTADFEDACMEQTNGLGYDLVLDFTASHVP